MVVMVSDGFSKLLRRPIGGWVRRDIHVRQTTRAMLDDHTYSTRKVAVTAMKESHARIAIA